MFEHPGNRGWPLPCFSKDTAMLARPGVKEVVDWMYAAEDPDEIVSLSRHFNSLDAQSLQGL